MKLDNLLKISVIPTLGLFLGSVYSSDLSELKLRGSRWSIDVSNRSEVHISNDNGSLKMVHPSSENTISISINSNTYKYDHTNAGFYLACYTTDIKNIIANIRLLESKAGELPPRCDSILVFIPKHGGEFSTNASKWASQNRFLNGFPDLTLPSYSQDTEFVLVRIELGKEQPNQNVLQPKNAVEEIDSLPSTTGTHKEAEYPHRNEIRGPHATRRTFKFYSRL